tara:strand:- start:5470 stop:5820 length:351 start_codon:yes stop_codon:yes gene_type:complete
MWMLLNSIKELIYRGSTFRVLCAAEESVKKIDSFACPDCSDEIHYGYNIKKVCDECHMGEITGHNRDTCWHCKGKYQEVTMCETCNGTGLDWDKVKEYNREQMKGFEFYMKEEEKV